MKYFFILVIPLICAWGWPTHQQIAEAGYSSLPLEIQHKLNLTLIQEGAIAPDKDFHDTVLHSYPKSYEKAKFWLELTKQKYLNKEYNNASHSYGVLTHYISDTFAAPHNVKKEDSKLHSQFEKQPDKIKTKCFNKEFELHDELIKATENSKDWYLWINNKSKEIPQKEVEQAMELIYPLTLQLFNTNCLNKKTKIIKVPFIITDKIIIYLTLVFAMITLYFISKI